MSHNVTIIFHGLTTKPCIVCDTEKPFCEGLRRTVLISN